MIDDEDRALFRAEMASVRPLRSSGKRALSAQKPEVARAAAPKVLAPKPQNFLTTDDMGVEWLDADQVLSYCGNGLSAQQFKQLRLGKFSINAILDLHGDTVEGAAERLFKFMQRAQARHCRVIKIIHGKGLHASDGTAKLKSHVAKWLHRFDKVLAFHSAPPNLGGRGAVLVMLRRD
jgi:hypothetical protein